MIKASEILSRLYCQAENVDYIGESVTQLQHTQEAAHLAQVSGDDELVLAALLHDVGHLCFPEAEVMGDMGVLNHESLGADYLLGLGFSHRVIELVRGHVAAKRYLVTTRVDYAAKLSPASQTTLTYQGGLMSEEEVRQFEQHPDFSNLLKLRAWDEAAKTEKSVPAFGSYVNLIDDHTSSRMLKAQDLASFQSEGYLHLTNLLPEATKLRLKKIVGDMESWPELPGQWMKYFETGSENQRLLCRIENFLQYEPLLRMLLNGPWLTGLVSQLMEEPAVLFKEKINFKLPGAGGFAAHQDAPAFTSFDQAYHITLMLSFDPSDANNGCLEVAPGHWPNKHLDMKPDKTLTDHVVNQTRWRQVPTQVGDIVLFGSYIPHRSQKNLSTSPRRALYATYNRLSEGDVRSRYFEEKRRVFPPDVEKVPGKDYSDSGVFNVGNPVSGN